MKPHVKHFVLQYYCVQELITEFPQNCRSRSSRGCSSISLLILDTQASILDPAFSIVLSQDCQLTLEWYSTSKNTCTIKLKIMITYQFQSCNYVNISNWINLLSNMSHSSSGWRIHNKCQNSFINLKHSINSLKWPLHLFSLPKWQYWILKTWFKFGLNMLIFFCNFLRFQVIFNFSSCQFVQSNKNPRVWPTDKVLLASKCSIACSWPWMSLDMLNHRL